MIEHTSPAMAIYCCPVSNNNNPFSEDYYWQAYQDLILAIQDHGIRVYIILDQDSYLGNGTFASAYTLKKKTTLDRLSKVSYVKVDLVFNRSNFAANDVMVVNNPYVHQIGMDKAEMYARFADYQPFTIVCNSRDQVEKAFDRIEGHNVVVKKPVSYGGRDVYIGTKDKILGQIPNEYPLLVQEFLDTSKGVSGIVKGVHDMRMSICGGKLIGCYIRKAKQGSLHSNVSQGGKMIFIDIADAPKEVVNAAMEIDAYFAAYPRYYSVDFIYTDKGWKMLELNPLLALLPRTDGAEAVKTLEKLADYLTTVTVTVHANNMLPAKRNEPVTAAA